MNILNEEFKSKFFKKLNKTLKKKYEEDYNNQYNFIEEATKFLKNAYAYGTNIDPNISDEEYLKKLKDEEAELKDKFNVSTTDYSWGCLRDFWGYNEYGKRGEVRKKYNTIKYAKEALSHSITPASYNHEGSKVRTNNTSANNSETNSFKFISKILNRYYGYDIANISDDQVKKLDKLPKVISDNSKVSGQFIFWFKSEEPENEELLDSDILVGISYGSQVYYPESSMHHGKWYGPKIKDLTENLYANKAYRIINTEEEKNNLNSLRNERNISRTIYTYEEIFEKPSYSEVISLDEIPEPTHESPSYIEVDGHLYSKTYKDFRNIDFNLQSIISNDELTRDLQYKSMIEDKVNYYKTIVKRNRLERAGDGFDKSIKSIIEKTHEYLFNNRQIKTSDLRTIYQYLDKLLEKYDRYLDYKKSLIKRYDKYYEKEVVLYKNECTELINKIIKKIEL